MWGLPLHATCLQRVLAQPNFVILVKRDHQGLFSVRTRRRNTIKQMVVFGKHQIQSAGGPSPAHTPRRLCSVVAFTNDNLT